MATRDPAVDASLFELPPDLLTELAAQRRKKAEGLDASTRAYLEALNGGAGVGTGEAILSGLAGLGVGVGQSIAGAGASAPASAYTTATNLLDKNRLYRLKAAEGLKPKTSSIDDYFKLLTLQSGLNARRGSIESTEAQKEEDRKLREAIAEEGRKSREDIARAGREQAAKIHAQNMTEKEKDRRENEIDNTLRDVSQKSAKFAPGVHTANKVYNELLPIYNEYLALYNKNQAGPVAGRLNTLASKLGISGTEVKLGDYYTGKIGGEDFEKFKTKSINALANKILQMSGKASSEQEQKRLAETVFNPNMTPEQFRGRLQGEAYNIYNQYLVAKKDYETAVVDRAAGAIKDAEDRKKFRNLVDRGNSVYDLLKSYRDDPNYFKSVKGGASVDAATRKQQLLQKARVK